MFSNKGLSRNCSLLTAPRSVPVRVKPGAGAPTAGSSPTVLMGFPRKVICAMRTVCQGPRDAPEPGAPTTRVRAGYRSMMRVRYGAIPAVRTGETVTAGGVDSSIRPLPRNSATLWLPSGP